MKWIMKMNFEFDLLLQIRSINQIVFEIYTNKRDKICSVKIHPYLVNNHISEKKKDDGF